MPKQGMQSMRRAHLADAAILEIGRAGSLDVTVSQIARRAGVSSALAHHYFGTKEQLFLFAMRRVLQEYRQNVLSLLKVARTPRERVLAVVEGNFTNLSFRPDAVSAWLNLYVKALTSPELERYLHIYQRRMMSTLLPELRPILGDRAEAVAEGIASMIDGLHMRQNLTRTPMTRPEMIALITDYVDYVMGTRQ